MSPEVADSYRHHVTEVTKADAPQPPHWAHGVFRFCTPAEEKGLRQHFGFPARVEFEDVALGSWRAGLRRIRRALRSQDLL